MHEANVDVHSSVLFSTNRTFSTLVVNAWARLHLKLPFGQLFGLNMSVESDAVRSSLVDVDPEHADIVSVVSSLL